MQNIEKMSCVEKLQHKGASFRLNGLVECLDKRSATTMEINQIKKLKNDKTEIAGRTISAYATALLDVIDAERYNGQNTTVLELIKSWR